MSTLRSAPVDPALTDADNARHCFALDRRTFLKLFGGGLLVCLTAESALAQEAQRIGTQSPGAKLILGAWGERLSPINNVRMCKRL